jgi:hypothetical protein
MACLSSDVPCSLGMRGYSSSVSSPPPATEGVVNVAGVAPGTQSIQNLVNAPAQAYPLAHRVYVNSVLGTDGLSGPEERLGVCWTRSSLARSAALQNDLIELPGGVSCEDFDETACGATSNVDACAASAPSCDIDPSRELMITDVSVVEDPIRTTGQGAWTIKHIAEQIWPNQDATGVYQDAAANIENFLHDFFEQAVYMQGQPTGGFPVPELPRDAAGNLDLAQAPFRLLAITSRVDLRDLANGSAGEARFTFGLINPDGTSFGGGAAPSNDQNSFTVIFEFTLPGQSEADALAWAQSWHALGAIPRPSGAYTAANEPYNSALQALTDRFIAPGAFPGRPNGSPLNAVRTRDPSREMREFVLCSPSAMVPVPGGCIISNDDRRFYPTGWLIPNPVSRTPLFDVDRVQLGVWLNANAAEVSAQPTDYELEFSCPFDGLTPIVTSTCAERDAYADLGIGIEAWNPTNVDPTLRDTFAINTCNGCHESETAAGQFQIAMRAAGSPASLSTFLTGTAKVVALHDTDAPVNAPSDPTPRHFNELERRAADLRNIVCPLSCGPTGPMPDGLHRVH